MKPMPHTPGGRTKTTIRNAILLSTLLLFSLSVVPGEAVTKRSVRKPAAARQFVAPAKKAVKKTKNTKKAVKKARGTPIANAATSLRPVEVWWPTNQASVTGTQPFKAVLKDELLQNYSMFWRVDGGQLNRMNDSYEGVPHKEASVDLSGWTWKGEGPYAVTFIAQNKKETVLGQQNVQIYTRQMSQPVPVVIPPPTAPAPAPTPAPAPAAIDVWWPTDRAQLSGLQPFKALVENVPITGYTMTWQVDGGQPNGMADSYADYPHKESTVDVSGWTWKGSGPYAITFVAKDMNGKELVRTTRTVTITGTSTASAPAPSPTQPAPTPSPTPVTEPEPSTTGGGWTDGFAAAATLEESGSAGASASPNWWVNSGGRMIVSGGTAKTIHGDLPSSDRWYQAYASANPTDTDGGKHPQNIFRLVQRGAWDNFTQQAYFKINRMNVSTSPNRNASNGLLLFNRYVDGQNLYYAGVRVDGQATIKKKQNGAYTTLAGVPVYPGAYNRDTNPNLMPLNTWIGLRSVLQTNSDGSVTIKLFIDQGRTGAWRQIAEATDRSNPITAKANAGIRTDFLDGEFEDYSIVQAGASTNASPTPTVTPAPTPITTTAAPSGIKLYVNPNSPAKRQADAWRASRPTDAAMMDKIAGQATAQWLGGWNANVQSDVNATVTAAANAGAVPVFVAYNIPNRDCGGYSQGGASTADAYKNWINSLAAGIANRPAIVILEPDGLASLDCLSYGEQQTRIDLLSFAVTALKAQAGAKVYLDAGHSGWIPAGEMASRLGRAGVGRTDGFALNVSNFMTTSNSTAYGQSVSQLLGGKHFVIDTARNGNGPTPDNQWCNPPGRALGLRPTTSTGNGLIDAYLWGKVPGESDGQCNGGPSAGVWWPDYALGLAQRAAW